MTTPIRPQPGPTDDPLRLAKRKRYNELLDANPQLTEQDAVAAVEQEFRGRGPAPRMPGFAAESTAASGAPPVEGPSFGSQLKGSARALLGQGLGMQFGDELEAGVRTGSFSSPEYKTLRDKIRAEQAQFAQNNPIMSPALEIGGAALPAIAALVGSGGAAAPALAAGGRSLLGRAATGAAVGAGYGAVQGAGAAPEMEDVPGSMATSGGLGAAFGLAFPLAGAGIGLAGDVAETGVRGAAQRGGAMGRMAQRAVPMLDRRAEARARAKLGQAFGDDMMTPEQAAERLREMTQRGAPAVVADVGEENVRELANTAFLIPGEGRRRIAQTATDRVKGTSGRLAENVERTGRTTLGNTNQVVREIAEARKAPAARLYNAAFEAGDVTLDERGIDLLLSTDFRKSWYDGARLAKLDNTLGNAPALKPLYRKVVNEAGQETIELVRMPTVRDIDYIKKGLDELIDEAERKGKGNLVRIYTQAKNELLGQVDQQVPVYAEARQFWGGQEGLMRAIEKGKRFLRGGDDDFADQVAGFTQDELEMYRRGAANGIAEMLRRRDGRATALNILTDPTAQARLKQIFPDEESFEMLRKVIGDEERMGQLYNRTMRQSQTAQNLAGILDFATDIRPGTFTQTSPRDLASRAMAGLVNTGLRGTQASSATALSKLLTTGGEEGAQLLESLGPEAMRAMRRMNFRSGLGRRVGGYAGGTFGGGSRE